MCIKIFRVVSFQTILLTEKRGYSVCFKLLSRHVLYHQIMGSSRQLSIMYVHVYSTIEQYNLYA